MTSEELEARITILEDIEAIKKHQHMFVYMIDDRDWQGVVNLFTEDAVLDLGPFGRYEGKAEITKFYNEIFPATYSFMAHMLHNPIIDVKGDKATGEWHSEMSGTYAPTDRAVWVAGKCKIEYVKAIGEWKFKTIKVTIYYNTPYDEGWVKTKMYE